MRARRVFTFHGSREPLRPNYMRASAKSRGSETLKGVRNNTHKEGPSLFVGMGMPFAGVDDFYASGSTNKAHRLAKNEMGSAQFDCDRRSTV